MKFSVRKSVLSTMILATALAPFVFAQAAPRGASSAPIGDSAWKQMSALLAEKEARTPAQRKIGSSLIYRAQRKKGINLLPGFNSLKSRVPERADGLVDVQITGHVTKALITAIQNRGGQAVSGHINGPLLRALVPLDAVEPLAARSDVHTIREAMQSATQQQLARLRAEALRKPLTSAVNQVQWRTNKPLPNTSIDDRGSVVSEGVKAHRADSALMLYGATGAGVNVGVLSSSDDFKEAAIASGDLPPDAFTIPGQSGRPGSGEGTAMMEIVHDMAPAAKLFFASADESPEAFADNIRQLRFTYHCDVIIDDVIYYFESPYQDDIIAHAVNDVIADGAMYFSSAGNEGNLADGTSGTWEGDYHMAKNGLGTLPSGYQAHDFGAGVISDRVEVSGDPLILHWSDPSSLDVPQATDDYDLFVLDEDLRNVLIASTDIQDGTGIPFEFIDATIPVNSRIVIARKPGATDRAVRVELFGGELGLATSGGVYGHSAAVAAYSVAAVDVAEAGGGAFTGGPTTPVELFSSDGNRRVFFDQDGNAYNGKWLFKNAGGQLRYKPDIAAADGVSTTLPGTSGLNPFFGTSAAAPHAGAIAAMMKSVKPTVKPAAVRTALKSSALDIEAPGHDIDSGIGIADAQGAMAALHATPRPFLELGTVTVTSSNPFLEPGDTGAMTTQLVNVGGASATGLSGVISTTTPGVTLINSNSAFPNIPGLGGNANNNTPFTFALAPSVPCGTAPEFELTTTYSAPQSPQTFDFKIETGQPGATPTDVPYTGAVTAIPDGNAVGVDVPITVTGLTSAIANLTFSFDGDTCTAAQGATTVGLDHSWIGDLTITLMSPSGTVVTLLNRAGGINNSGNNFCKTVLDDSAANSIQNISIAGAPWTGSFSPASPLAAFKGEDPNGTWILHAVDNVTIDSGHVRAFTLHIQGYTCN